MSISSRFSSTLPTTVHAASSATSMPSGAGPSGSVASLLGLRPGRSPNAAQGGLVQLHEPSSSRRSAVAGQAEPEPEPGLRRRPSAPPRRDPPGQRLRGLDVDRVVQRDQGLERRVRPGPADGADFAVRGVEGGHRGIGVRPPPGACRGRGGSGRRPRWSASRSRRRRPRSGPRSAAAA